MRRFISLLSLFLVSLAAPAQDLPPCPVCEEEALQIQRKLLRWQLENQMTTVEREIAERRAAEYEQREFARKLNRFVEIWNRLLSEHQKGRTFNVKTARALSKAFRDIEATGWPK